MDTIKVYLRPHRNWAGQKYYLLSTKENGTLAEVDCHDDYFRIFGDNLLDWEVRKTKAAAINLAKRLVRSFFARIGESRTIEFV